MNYEIKGTPLPVLVCTLEQNESMVTESGAMAWMSENMEMKTSSNGGAGKVFSRLVSGEHLFQNIYTARNGKGMISFASSFPGEILAVDIEPGKDIIVQKSCFLASETSVELSMFFRKKLGAGLFGGEGFIMQRLSGSGKAFIEIDGSCVTYDLEAGQSLVASTGYVVMMDASCTMDVVSVKGVKNMVFGGEGIFNTKVTGPGRVIIQSMPIAKLAGVLAPFIATGS